jgi:hypothetical protein
MARPKTNMAMSPGFTFPGCIGLKPNASLLHPLDGPFNR